MDTRRHPQTTSPLLFEGYHDTSQPHIMQSTVASRFFSVLEPLLVLFLYNIHTLMVFACLSTCPFQQQGNVHIYLFTEVVVNHCFTSLFGTYGLLSDIAIRLKRCSQLMR